VKDELLSLLKQHWGYESFLPNQEDVIASVLEKRDTLTVLSTGGGKSLCFQLPALMAHGMAVVVSPLISLMKDQVDSLRDMDIPACYLNSTMTGEEQFDAAMDIREGKIKLLYLSPERLLAESTIELLTYSKVSFFVIDEAHCISHWGHDFREEYRNLRVIKDKFRDIPVHAFTATATREVQRDIVEQLKLKDPGIHIGRIDRPNLTYRIYPRNNIMREIKGVLDKHRGEGGIIYCLRRKDVDSVSEDLRKTGIVNVRYHAGMSDKDRHISQEKFSREEVDVIVATIAFGMGIDRSNIRYIIHAGMPKSLEHYQQETGRAGRDGLPAFCYMFYSGADYRLWSYFAEQSRDREVMIKKLGDMYNFASRPNCRHRTLVNYFGEELSKVPCGSCDYCLSELEMISDALSVGQKILSAVLKVSEGRYGFGAGYVSNVLKGRSDERIERLGHNEITAFGLMRDESDMFIRYMIEQLIGQGFLVKEGEYLTLAVTKKGKQLLLGEISPVLVKPLVAAKKKEITARAARKRVEEWVQADHGLFQKLREKRTELAANKGVPAYIIFSDKTLRDIAAKKPRTRAEFEGIYGVGQSKLASYADIFIQVVKDNG
jgi:ATP-dependent DNA helicase RecQ